MTIKVLRRKLWDKAKWKFEPEWHLLKNKKDWKENSWAFNLRNNKKEQQTKFKASGRTEIR